jgi:hypothetical protein
LERVSQEITAGNEITQVKISKMTAYKIYKKLHNLYCSPNIMWMMKSRRRSCYEIRDVGKFLVEALREDL